MERSLRLSRHCPSTYFPSLLLHDAAQLVEHLPYGLVALVPQLPLEFECGERVLVAVSRCMVTNQYRNGSFEFSITVPFGCFPYDGTFVSRSRACLPSSTIPSARIWDRRGHLSLNSPILRCKTRPDILCELQQFLFQCRFYICSKLAFMPVYANFQWDILRIIIQENTNNKTNAMITMILEL